ncbi:hypothetical protein L1987_51402 [Smallanthus sonchifolius]|uniref:Uncharacterized protein n=1 Tax=Smallanthus sonchifolius TaxID=185202 RepID=A0ACB9EQ93_9ASTR|nr:hypothetical protein L1987_51402 [Smallanthus sonchifolius]
MADSSISHYQLKRPLKQQRDFTLSPTLYLTGILSSGSAPTTINFTRREHNITMQYKSSSLSIRSPLLIEA